MDVLNPSGKKTNYDQDKLYSNAVGGSYAVVGGGETNSSSGTHSFTGGGSHNNANGDSSVIGGGFNNTTNKATSSILGGFGNTTDGIFSSIGGGSNSHVTSFGDHATIPGGENLTAICYAQTIVGYNNKLLGTFASGQDNSLLPGGNDRLFIVGNGNTTESRSNAFEVSYNGHSSVFHSNGTGGASAVPPGAAHGHGAFKGTTYKDNVLYAWGVVAAVFLMPPTLCTDPDNTAFANVQEDFGVATVVQSVSFSGLTKFTITLNVVDPYTNASATFNYPAVVVTPKYVADMCPTVMVNPIGGAPYVFEVFIKDANHSCQTVPMGFAFHISGRPN